MGQDLVLYALGEEGVCFFFAQIFKRSTAMLFSPAVASERAGACAKRENRSGERRDNQKRDCHCRPTHRVRCFLTACNFFGSCALPNSLSVKVSKADAAPCFTSHSPRSWR